MARTLVFPYSITLEEDGRPHLYPAAEVGFPSPDGGWFALFLLVDSGAVTSALPKRDASAFGIDAEAGREQAIVGVEGVAIRGWEHIMRIRLGGGIVDIPLVFVDSDKAPRVLGREGIFDRFTIIFEEVKRRTGFLDQESPPAQAVGDLLDEL